MGVGVRVKVWGDYALFSRPEMKVERCSYDVMGSSAIIRFSLASYSAVLLPATLGYIFRT